MSRVVLAILNGHAIPPRLNHTFVALIPKKHKPDSISDFRPISLYNVVYKLVMKVLSNRLKGILRSIISDS